MLGISFFGIDFFRCAGKVKEGWRVSSTSTEAVDLEEDIAGGGSEGGGGGGGASDGGGAGGCMTTRNEGYGEDGRVRDCQS